jgi:EF-P beta-lysylation protein EpmB
MIPHTTLSGQTNDWQCQLSNLITDPHELLEIVQLLPTDPGYQNIVEAGKQFQLRVPRGFAEKIEKGNPQDPLLLQVLPSARELIDNPQFSADPLDEQSSNPIAGLIHKYQSRVLVTLSGQCAINCRYCFRRHFPYGDNRLTGENLKTIIAYIRDNKDLNEVIFSGGDPLSVSNVQISRVLSELKPLEHITRVRFHTRVPVVIPERIDNSLLESFDQYDKRILMVLHSNHPKELDNKFDQAMASLSGCGVALLNQTVLLKGINDDENTLVALSERLFSAGIMPYYLHLLDKVSGASHFDVDENTAIQLHHLLQARLPGYLVPKLVREIAGKPSKTWVF